MARFDEHVREELDRIAEHGGGSFSLIFKKREGTDAVLLDLCIKYGDQLAVSVFPERPDGEAYRVVAIRVTFRNGLPADDNGQFLLERFSV